MEAGIYSTCGVHGLVIKRTELLVSCTFMLRNNVPVYYKHLCEYCSCAPVLSDMKVTSIPFYHYSGEIWSVTQTGDDVNKKTKKK
jgi:hypothetical protein